MAFAKASIVFNHSPAGIKIQLGSRNQFDRVKLKTPAALQLLVRSDGYRWLVKVPSRRRLCAAWVSIGTVLLGTVVSCLTRASLGFRSS